MQAKDLGSGRVGENSDSLNDTNDKEIELFVLNEKHQNTLGAIQRSWIDSSGRKQYTTDLKEDVRMKDCVAGIDRHGWNTDTAPLIVPESPSDADKTYRALIGQYHVIATSSSGIPLPEAVIAAVDPEREWIFVPDNDSTGIKLMHKNAELIRKIHGSEVKIRMVDIGTHVQNETDDIGDLIADGADIKPILLDAPVYVPPLAESQVADTITRAEKRRGSRIKFPDDRRWFFNKVASEEIGDWRVEPFLRAGQLSQLVGYPEEARKTTILSAVGDAQVNGKNFLKHTAKDPRGLIYLTEEWNTLSPTLAKAGLLDATKAQLEIIPVDAPFLAGADWDEVVGALGDRCIKFDSDLIIDSIVSIVNTTSKQKLFDGWNNDTDAVNKVLQPLRRIRPLGIGVLMVRHSNKRSTGG